MKTQTKLIPLEMKMNDQIGKKNIVEVENLGIAVRLSVEKNQG